MTVTVGIISLGNNSLLNTRPLTHTRVPDNAIYTSYSCHDLGKQMVLDNLNCGSLREEVFLPSVVVFF